jgi:hypothetical protein
MTTTKNDNVGKCGHAKCTESKTNNHKPMKKLYAKYTDEAFTTPEAFQEFLRSGKRLKYDYVIVGGVLYTMHEYDMSGESVVWANKKHMLHMSVDTSNRYGALGYTDATVSVYELDI